MHAAAQPSSRAGSSASSAAQAPLAQRKCACCESGESCQRRGVLDSPGQRLDTGTKSTMESRFGQDFSHVRIHADSAANASASAAHASAYTVGNHIAFASGRYRPGDPRADMLLAHELTHVVQQGGTRGPLRRAPDADAEVTTRDDAADEDQADIAAEAVSFGWKVHVPVRHSGVGVARAPLAFGDAAGGCGICYRGNVRQVGTDVHDQVQTVMQTMYRFLLPNFVIQPKKTPPFLALDPKKMKGLGGALKKAKGAFKKLIPDLIMPTPTGFAVGEIKPANSEGLIEGEAKLQLYEHFLKARYRGINPGLTLTRMNLPPPPPLPFLDPKAITCQQALVVNPAINGLYTYWCNPAFSNEVRKNCRCIGDAKEGEDKALKKTNMGFGLSIGGSSTSAYSAGIGVSIYSSGLGVGNAGVSVSIMSSGIGAGNASVGAAIASSGQSVGGVGAGATLDTTTTAAGTAGIGASKDSTATVAGAAGIGTSSGTDTKAAGVAGIGSVKDSDITATGTAGSGNVEDASGKAGNKPPTAADAGEGGGTGTPGSAAGATKTGDQASTGTGSGTGSGTGTGAGGKAGDKASDKAGDKPGGGAGTTPGDAQGKDAGQPGAAGQGTRKAGSDLLNAKEMAAFGLKGKPVTYDQLDAALEQARIIRKLIDIATPDQQALLRAIANDSPDGQYAVPAAEWIQKMLTATEGIGADDIAYLKTLNWKPAKVSAADLRKSILAALAKKPKTPPKTEGTTASGGKAENKEGAPAKGTGPGKDGKSDMAGASSGKDSATPGVKGGEVTEHRISMDDTNTARDFWFVNFENFDVHNATAGQTVQMTLAFFAEDRGVYTFKHKFTIKERTVANETSKKAGKTVTRKAVTFKLEGLNEARWDIAPAGKRPFILPKNVQATFKGFL